MFSNQNSRYAGVPYDDINWYDVDGQPFGIASNFNAIILGNANNIVDTKGAMAVGGNFNSSRGLSLGYGNDGDLTDTGYSPNLVRFLVGGNVAMQGPLVVIGHVVTGGNFRAARGSTYMIGKDGSPDQIRDLTSLYQANGGSRYWSVSDRGTNYAISSYDVPRFIPASRIQADTARFFADAEASMIRFRDCITNLAPNGTVTEHYHEWILRGNDPRQNVFLVDVRPSGILDKEIRFEIPEGSVAIVILRTGDRAHLKYGLWGAKNLAERTLYVFEDAQHIYMEVPAAIWGSIFAPQASFHAHSTGGTVSGNAALGSLEMNATTGFEFHLYPFIGGVVCRETTPAPIPPVPPEEIPIPIPTPPVEIPRPIPTPPPAEIPRPIPTPPPAEIPRPIPTPPPAEIPRPIPTPPPAEIPRPIPTPPPAEIPRPIPTPPPAEIPRPIPTPPPVRIPRPMPTPPPVRIPRPIPTPPPARIPRPTPTPPPFEIPRPVPIPPPAPTPCPPCPECPKPSVQLQPIPIPIPIPCPEQQECEECLIKPGLIFGCIWGCECDGNHEWEIKLFKNCGESRKLVHCIKICNCGCFEFHVPYDNYYVLQIRPIGVSTHRRNRHMTACKPMITLKNVGVANLMIE